MHKIENNLSEFFSFFKGLTCEEQHELIDLSFVSQKTVIRNFDSATGEIWEKVEYNFCLMRLNISVEYSKGKLVKLWGMDEYDPGFDDSADLIYFIDSRI